MGKIAGFLLLALQFYFIFDAYRRRKFIWIFVIFFLPGIGVAMYFLIEKLPELRKSGLAEQAGEGLESFFFPEKELKELEEKARYSPSFKNRLALADAYQRAGRFEDALDLYEEFSQGPNKKDPNVWKGIAFANYQLGNFNKVPAAIEKMRQFRSGNKPSEFDLLLPRALVHMGNLEAAEVEYSVLADTFSGEEARCRYAQFLKERGKVEEAREIFEEMVRYAKASPQYYQQAQKEWINIAKRELKS